MSTLNPGKVSKMMRDLYLTAEKESQAVTAKNTSKPAVNFDIKNSVNNKEYSEMEDSLVSRYVGQNSEHIGNGAGGVL